MSVRADGRSETSVAVGALATERTAGTVSRFGVAEAADATCADGGVTVATTTGGAATIERFVSW